MLTHSDVAFLQTWFGNFLPDPKVVVSLHALASGVVMPPYKWCCPDTLFQVLVSLHSLPSFVVTHASNLFRFTPFRVVVSFQPLPSSDAVTHCPIVGAAAPPPTPSTSAPPLTEGAVVARSLDGGDNSIWPAGGVRGGIRASREGRQLPLRGEGHVRAGAGGSTLNR